MPRLKPNAKKRSLTLKVVAFFAALGLHVALLAAMVSRSEPALPDMAGGAIHYVELGDIGMPGAVSDDTSDVPAVASPEPNETDDTEVMDEPVPEPITEPEPEPEPIPEPEPEPEPIPEPAPQPRAAAEPKPAAPAAAAAPAAQALDNAPQGASSAPSAADAGPTDTDQPRFVSNVEYQGRRPNPVYPRASMRRGEQGKVVIRVLISTSGSVENASVVSSSGFDRLDQSALKAVRAARFKPYKVNGVAYQALADIPINFVL